MITLLTLFFLTFVAIPNSGNCRCEDPGTVKEAYEYTETIIRGKVISKEFVSYESTMNPEKVIMIKERYKDDKRKMEYLQSEFIIKLDLQTNNTFKGKILSDTLTLYTTRNGASCGFTRFEFGQEYLIYASSHSYAYWIFVDNEASETLELSNTYWTNQCSRTTEYNKLEESELLKLKNK